MDSVRFGRALGIGARSAARALAGAVEAAAAPNPAKSQTSSPISPQPFTRPQAPARPQPPVQSESPVRPSPPADAGARSRPAATGQFASATQTTAHTAAQNPAQDAVKTAAQTAARTAARATVRARDARKGIARGSKRFGESVWGPFARLSRVLWLEVTGSFFAIFALFAGGAAWTHRADLRLGFNAGATPGPGDHAARLHLLVFLAMTLVFAYFSVSSFVRAYRK